MPARPAGHPWRPVKRLLVAGTLWPDATESRAYASLRSALSRLDGTVRDAVEVIQATSASREASGSTSREAQLLAHRLLETADQPLDPADLSGAAIAVLSQELLPDWYEDWVLLESEDWRQLRLHAVEALAGLLTAASRYGDAAQAALTAVRVDRLRESSRTVLIKVHLAEQNRSEALREFKRYHDLLRAELDIEPSPELRQLLDPPPEDVTPR